MHCVPVLAPLQVDTSGSFVASPEALVRDESVGMDPRFGIAPDDLYTLQMEVKQVQYAQSNHAERLSRLEKRQADDAALKSVWNSPFPGVLSGTPQHGTQ